MPVIDNNELDILELPGLRHQTIAGHKQGVTTMEVWSQTMAPGAATPVHRHACEEVILVLSGHMAGDTDMIGVVAALRDVETKEGRTNPMRHAGFVGQIDGVCR